jgi:hypothetical protein
MALPASLEDWRAEHATARKRADKAQRLGYRFVNVLRDKVADEIFAINTSKANRQGRPMSAGYLRSHRRRPTPYIRVSGMASIRTASKRRTELSSHTSGSIAPGSSGLVSQIFGHADHLEHGSCTCSGRGC